MSDWELLNRYCDGSQQAFAELVARHAGWVRAVARRRLHDDHLADDAAQAVFIVLSQKSARLAQTRSLAAWLFEVTRLTVARQLRDERRRRARETQAATMRMQEQASGGAQGTGEWCALEPILDASVARLRRRDREAVLLRFYQQKTFVEVGEAIGSSEDAARKRVDRAVQRLREILGSRGVAAPSVLALAQLLYDHASGGAAAHAAAAAATTVATLRAVSWSGASDGARRSAVALAHGVLSMMMWQKLRIAGVAASLLVMLGLTGLSLLSRATAQVEPDRQAASTSTADAPTTQPVPPRITQLAPILNVADIPASIDFYVEKLGFQKLWEFGTPAQFAAVSRDRTLVMFSQNTDGPRGIVLYAYVTDVDALHEEFLSRGAPIAAGPVDQTWGMREMLIDDLDGHKLLFAAQRPPPTTQSQERR